MYAIVQCEELQISWPNTKEKAVETVAGFSSISTNHVIQNVLQFSMATIWQ